LKHRVLIVHALYLAALLLSSIGAAVFASFDAPYGTLVYLEAILYSLLGGLTLYPLPALLAFGLKRGLKRGVAVAAAAAILLLALYPLHARLYSGYVKPSALGPASYVANAPQVFILTLLGGALILLHAPSIVKTLLMLLKAELKNTVP